MLSDEEIDKLRKAGWIAKKVLENTVRIVKPGVKIIDLVNYIEKNIEELGGKPAFPVNIGINEIAAHYTPLHGDNSTIPDNSVLKIDIGVHVDGYIADTAITISFNPAYEGLVEAPRRALEKVLNVIKPGIKLNTIGRIIEETINEMGYRVIKNLSGHSIDRYLIHSGRSIPNTYEVFNRDTLVNGVYAIEPFATNGVGFVKDTSLVTIYSLKEYSRKKLGFYEEKLYNTIWFTRKTLPFCERWFIDMYDSVEKIRGILNSLESKGIVRKYPVLVEDRRGVVSQFEHTIVVSNRDIIVTTI
uniref:Methionine aminopeptidase n=1 Tax=Staphylothermus marinus TaxID=2280 RepID=A0A7C4D7I2_STAMA